MYSYLSFGLTKSFIKTFIFGTQVFLEVVITVFTALIFSPLRLFAIVVAKCFNKDLVGIVNVRDSREAFCGPKTADVNNVICVTLEGAVPLERLRTLFQSRIMEVKDLNGNFVYDRFTWSWTFFLGYAFWKRINFKLEDHFRSYDLTHELSLPNPCSEKDVENVLGGLCAKPWSPERSQWEILIIKNYLSLESDGNTSLNTGIIIRANQLIMDGRNWVQLVRKVFDITSPLPTFKNKKSGRSRFGKILLWFKLPFDYIEMSRELRIENQFAADLPFPPNLAVGLSNFVPDKDIHDLRSAFGVSHAVVVQSIVLGALQNLLEGAQIPVPEELTFVYPVPQPREHWSDTGNN
ncbi:unnamed protein product [Allacma fusca]|uniref:Uncharacterized protein n=1 Tax=Allacma fusca TaxID=39272 RepID=A0A8J2PK93_9HEXA|nr:unnamed protein product [Allacma fusca]